jgi:predicted TIM-barrel fold metal-dependent hydrolase
VPAAIEELQRCARLGLRGAILPALLDGVQYNDPCYEPLWATAASLKMPLSFHIGGVRGLALDGGPPGTTDAYVLLGGLALAEPLSLVLFSGAFARYPDLKIVLVEGGIGWLAFLVERMDSMYERHRFWTQSVLTERPSTYFREHVRATFLRDSVGLRERETIGIGVPMWSSDYPHSDSTWPHSQEAIAQQFADIPEADRRRIVHDNAAELYGLR